MPIIAYQSFNANSSANHSLAATSMQRFTLDTNKHVTQKGHQALVLPSDSGNLAAPIEGPAHLKPIEILAKDETANVQVFGTQISLLWQNFYRAFGAMPDIMVCGEMDTSHPDFASMVTDSNVTLKPIPAKKACQCFTAICQAPVASQVEYLASAEGYAAYSVLGLVVVFVHVPNKIATSRNGTQDFYLKIAHSLAAKHKFIDLVIGDTNQSSFSFTAEVLNLAFGTAAYKNATVGAEVDKVDNFNVVEKGTNSTGTKMYDVAVYRSDVVDLTHPTVYLSQSSGAVTVTDHCGLGVYIERKKTGS